MELSRECITAMSELRHLLENLYYEQRKGTVAERQRIIRLKAKIWGLSNGTRGAKYGIGPMVYRS